MNKAVLSKNIFRARRRLFRQTLGRQALCRLSRQKSGACTATSTVHATHPIHLHSIRATHLGYHGSRDRGISDSTRARGNR